MMTSAPRLFSVLPVTVLMRPALGDSLQVARWAGRSGVDQVERILRIDALGHPRSRGVGA